MVSSSRRVRSWVGLGMAMMLLVAGVACNTTFPGIVPLLPFSLSVPISEPNQDRLDQFIDGFIGGSAQRFLIGRDPPNRVVAMTKVVAMNLETLAVEPIIEQTVPFSMSAVSDGHWLVWDDSVNPGLVVRDLETGAESRLFEDMSREDSNVRPLQVDGGRLVVLARSFVVSPPRSLLVIVDLASGNQRLIGPVASSGVALSGDLLAFGTRPSDDSDTPPFAEFLGGRNIELVDLATGEQKTLASNPDLSEIGRVWIAGTRVIWTEERPPDLSDELVVFGVVVVKSYDTQSGQSVTVTSLPIGRSALEEPERQQLADVGPGGILVRRTRAATPLLIGSLQLALVGQESESYEVRGFDGKSMPVIEFTGPFVLKVYPNSPPFSSTGARMVGDFIVLRDSISGDYVVHDVRTGSQRRFDPFAE